MIALVANDALQPKPIDWSETFSTQHKKPFGLYIFRKEFATIFPDCYTVSIYQNPYEYLKNELGYTINDATDSTQVNTENDEITPIEEEYSDENTEYQQDSITYTENEIVQDSTDYSDYDYKSTYIFINSLSNIDDLSVKYLLQFVEEGNQVFISSNDFPEILMDTLNIELQNNPILPIQINDTTGFQNIKFENPTIEMRLANPNLDTQNYSFNKGIQDIYFSKLDSVTTDVLGYQNYQQKEKINYVKINFGNGNFYLHTQPHVFTNFYLLKNTHQYAASVLSYLDSNEFLIDAQNDQYYQTTDNSLRYIFSQPSLKKAWLLGLFGMVMFMIFKAKRKQRIVPIIDKVPNTSIEFARTIGNLYFQERQPKTLVRHKINFFLEHIRNTYLLDTQNLNDDFKKKLQAKTGIPIIEISRLTDYVVKLSKLSEIKESHLVLLHQMLENFYQKTQ